MNDELFPDRNAILCALLLGHLKTIHFLFGTNGKLMNSGVPRFKHIRILFKKESISRRTKSFL